MQARDMGTWWCARLAVMLLLVFCAKELRGQNLGEGPVLGYMVDHAWPEVQLNVVVLDKQGVPLTVDEPKFQVFEDENERPVQVQRSLGSPVSLAVMIDLSGSSFKRKDAMFTAVKALVKGMPNGSEVAVVDFSGVAYLDLPFTDVSKADFSFLDKLGANGQTSLYDGLIAMEDYVVAHAKYPRRALVVLSDGGDNASRTSAAQALVRMERSGSPTVYACSPSKANVFRHDSRAGQAHMEVLAKGGGGLGFVLGSDPEATAADIARVIRSQYVLRFTAVEPTRDGEGRKLEVRLADSGLQVYGLPRYFAPVY